MEIIPEGRRFRLVNDDELPSILKVLEKHLPYSLKFHQTIKTYLSHHVWQFHFYVSKNWPEEEVVLHFPGCTLTPNKNIYESFGIFCPLEQLENVELIKSEDILLDWSMPLYLNYTHVDIVNQIESFSKHIGHVDKIQGETWVLGERGPDCLDLDELPSNEVEMRLLQEEDILPIHDLYPASEIESIEVFLKLTKILPGYGIFTLDGELAAWMVQSYYGAMFSMQTKPDFRRKGYGICLAQNLARLVIKRGFTPFVVIRHENEASKSLYKKLGFEKEFEMARIVFTPFEFKDEEEAHENGSQNGKSSNGDTGHNGHENV